MSTPNDKKYAPVHPPFSSTHNSTQVTRDRIMPIHVFSQPLVVLKSIIAHVTHDRFDPLDLVQFQMSLQIFHAAETLITLGTGEFFLAFLMPRDHVGSPGLAALEFLIAEGTWVGKNAWVDLSHVGGKGM